MKKATRYILSFLTAVGVTLAMGNSASAAGITFTEPANDAVVEASFTLAGTYGAGCAQQNLPVVAEDSKGNRGLVDSSGFSKRNDTSFRYTIDFSKPLEDTQGYIQEGPVTLQLGGGSECTLSEITVNYGQEPSPSAEQDSPSPSPDPTPTLSTPQPVDAEEPRGLFDDLDPALVLALGAVAGGAATALTEFSWLRYRRRK